jgi:sulfur-carrier protein
MLITVKYFASLRERVGKSQEALKLPDAATVADVWARVTPDTDARTFGGDGDSILAAVNHEYVDRDHGLRDGDEVAFFPPVTGG